MMFWKWVFPIRSNTKLYVISLYTHGHHDHIYILSCVSYFVPGAQMLCGRCSSPDWERSCSSCSSTNSGAADSGRQPRGGDWPGESEGWSCRMPPSRSHLQTHTQLIQHQRPVRHFFIQRAETHLFSWARRSSGHRLWPLGLWGTSVGICSWSKNDRPPAQRHRIQDIFLRTTPGQNTVLDINLFLIHNSM